ACDLFPPFALVHPPLPPQRFPGKTSPPPARRDSAAHFPRPPDGIGYSPAHTPGRKTYFDAVMKPPRTFTTGAFAVIAAAFFAMSVFDSVAAVSLVSPGSIWRYLANGTEPDAAWAVDPLFDDSGWS